MRKSAKVGELALKASYQVALRIAQCKKTKINLILPAATDMCKTMFGNVNWKLETSLSVFAVLMTGTCVENTRKLIEAKRREVF